MKHFEDKVVWLKNFSGFYQVWTLSKKHWAELSHLLLRHRGEQFAGEPNFEKIFFFFNSVEWLLVEFRTAIYVSRRTFSATFFWKTSLLFSFSDFEQSFCDNFSEMLPAIFSELNSMCTEEQIEKKLSDGKFRYHSFFPDFERRLSVTFGKNRFRGPCQKCLLRVQRNFLEKTTLWKFSCRWLLLEFERKPCGTIFKLLSRVQWNSGKSCTLRGKLKSLSFPHIMWNFIATSNDIGKIVKLAFIISKGTFWGQSSLNEKLFRLSIILDLSKTKWAELSHLLPRHWGEHVGGEPKF